MFLFSSKSCPFLCTHPTNRPPTLVHDFVFVFCVFVFCVFHQSLLCSCPLLCTHLATPPTHPCAWFCIGWKQPPTAVSRSKIRFQPLFLNCEARQHPLVVVMTNAIVQMCIVVESSKCTFQYSELSILRSTEDQDSIAMFCFRRLPTACTLYHLDFNKLASSVDAIAISEIWKHYHSLLTDRGRC